MIGEHKTYLREIPYNYTSFSDREIVLHYLDAAAWQTINQLRAQRRTGRSAKMLFEVLGDMWVIERNPYLQQDLWSSRRRWQSLTHALHYRLDLIQQRADDNTLATQLMQQAKHRVDQFIHDMSQRHQLQRKAYKALRQLTRRDNVCCDPYARVAHATDASDWRVAYPLLVLKPDKQTEINGLINCCKQLGLPIIARGGGTGYTGGAIPLRHDTVVINCEKLVALSDVTYETLPGLNKPVATITAEAGVVTQRVAQQAASADVIFAVDPTSQNASTIGGNIAMNAGGKKAVLWGTTLDNLARWRMITPQGQWLTVERLNHNLGKIHCQADVSFRLTHYDSDGTSQLGDTTTINLPGASLRKTGLGKDVTNKLLGGIPGIQKEGCDGLITEATFILHKKLAHTRTICLEFYGNDLYQAVNAIVAIRDHIDTQDQVLLAGLEHLDERYLKAVNYSAKASRTCAPKMVLIGDLVSQDEQALGQMAAAIIRLCNQRNGEGFIAVSPEARQKFWLPRTKTAAIAAHTNAFKINEDVVIPLEKLADYSLAIERINIEQSLHNKLSILQAIIQHIQQVDHQQLAQTVQKFFQEKQQAALSLLNTVQQFWQRCEQLDQAAETLLQYLPDALAKSLQAQDTIFNLLQQRRLRLSYHDSIAKPLFAIFSGSDYEPLRQKITAIHDKLLKRRLFVALHMHAGDGNVHTNIPVHSNDYAMMQTADTIVNRIMQLTTTLGGVISGEHGIGLTKMPFMHETVLTEFANYKQHIDPHNLFNPGKLQQGQDLRLAYTPSLRLLEQEALILKASQLGEINQDIKNCLRCGKCKPVCQTHAPQSNLLYSPRDKILATGAIIEAFLYEEQTRRGVSISHVQAFEEIADHCTVCHKCYNPCPVNIDFGDVSIKMRTLLTDKQQKRINLGTKLTMAYLNSTEPWTIKLMGKALLQWGFRLQNGLYKLMPFKQGTKQHPQNHPAPPKLREQVIQFMARPLPQGVAFKPMRQLLGLEDARMVPIVRDPNKTNVDSDAVFYFPGCGSERLFNQVSLASLATLFELGVQTVLPPGYLCCGYPQLAMGDKTKGEAITLGNRVLLHRLANSLNYLDINTVIVSCGTCMDQLLKYELARIFPNCRLLDIHEYLMESGMRLGNKSDVNYLYHDPCHSPMKTHPPLQVAEQLLGQAVHQTERCCGDAGTLSMSRPDIATQLRFTKEKSLKKGIQAFANPENPVKLLTSCPACIKGLASYRDSTGLSPDYIVVELAKQYFGDNWSADFLKKAQQGGIERVLL